jgi:ElaB/YqjD/DUF883 family membrane-anchored ribosome-binding protein
MSAGTGPLGPETPGQGATEPEAATEPQGATPPEATTGSGATPPETATPTPAATGNAAGAGASNPETEQIERDIEQTREQLGNTVEALTAKTDVKAQAQQKVEETKAAVSEKKDELFGKAREASPESASSAASTAAAQARENPLPVAAVGAFVVGVLFGRVTKRRR